VIYIFVEGIISSEYKPSLFIIWYLMYLHSFFFFNIYLHVYT
jgi:hypothetical protein